ncbi:tRNA pseudouridine(13) synthase TruD [Candidatus Woesearchaeota archaeon]|nr:tRNA pseudouridine(13) synthase TruD [Candidatus Woesearchaeota archaeon]
MDIKQTPEDFIVEEQIQLIFEPGQYLYVKATKKGWNTISMIEQLAEILHLPKKYFSFAGAKDKQAVTTQYISITHAKKEQIERIKIKDITLEVVGTGKNPIHLGDLTGNHFKIKLEFELPRTDFLVNYFGEQRFSANNYEIGKAMLEKDWKKACALINHEKINVSLQKYPADYIGALKKIDKKILSLYLHAVQARIWNKTVVRILQKEKNAVQYEERVFIQKRKENFTIPLISFDTDIEAHPYAEILKEALAEAGITKNQFILRSFPEILPVNTERQVFVDVKDWKYEKPFVEFTLPKGSYATMLVVQQESFLSRETKK